MATEQVVWDVSAKAENSLTTKQYYAVELSGADQVDVCDNIRDVVFGVLQNKPAANAAAQVRRVGKTKWVSDGTVGGGIAVGSYVGTNATGKAIVKATNDYGIAGIANGASTTDGAIIEVWLGVVPVSYRTPADA